MNIKKQYLLSLVFIILFQAIPTDVSSICQPNPSKTEQNNWKKDKHKRTKTRKAKRKKRDAKPITKEWVRRRAELSARFGTLSMGISLALSLAFIIALIAILLGTVTILNGGVILGSVALVTLINLVIVLGVPLALITSFLAIYFGTSARTYIDLIKDSEERYRILRLTSRGMYLGWITAALAGLISVLIFL